ncbi:DUF805 domain-containing protein [Pseudocitrobacter cyperus]|uniref:DUF805 domain-containing protein n=1 Tax=Pseudocitrobacter cyperus TaxID=3112843 RepID=A0ABV0HE69_9ENTR
MNYSFAECYWQGWKKTFDYKTRSNRSEFFLFVLINILIVVFIALVSYYTLVWGVSDHTSRGGLIFAWSYYVYYPLRKYATLILIFPFISLGVRRMHDSGRSGWWFGIPILFELIVLPIAFSKIFTFLISREVDYAFMYALGYIKMAMDVIIILFILWLCMKPSTQQNRSLT